MPKQCTQTVHDNVLESRHTVLICCTVCRQEFPISKLTTNGVGVQPLNDDQEALQIIFWQVDDFLVLFTLSGVEASLEERALSEDVFMEQVMDFVLADVDSDDTRVEGETAKVSNIRSLFRGARAPSREY